MICENASQTKSSYYFQNYVSDTAKQTRARFYLSRSVLA